MTGTLFVPQSSTRSSANTGSIWSQPGDANYSGYAEFRAGDNSRHGYIGYAHKDNGIIQIAAEKSGGHVNFSTGTGAGGPRVNGNEIWHAGNFNPSQAANAFGWRDASKYGVQANTGTSQNASLALAEASLPADGGVIVLPPGTITLGDTFTFTRQNVTLLGSGKYATFIDCTRLDTDVICFNGNYSGVKDCAFKSSAGDRTSGYTVNLRGAYTFCRDVDIRHCFRGIRMGPVAGNCLVHNNTMTFIATGSNRGAIVVDNPSYGPSNWISNCTIYGDGNDPTSSGPVGPRPEFGVQIVNSGATMINNTDILGFFNNLIINPGNGQTAQATYCSDVYFDSGQRDNILISPSGNGFVFETSFSNCWLTNTRSENSFGLRILGNGATGNSGRPVMNTRWDNGIIASTSNNPGYGFLVEGVGCINTVLSNSTVAGWGIGVCVGTNTSHVMIVNNMIGKYLPWDPNRANSTGLALVAGNGGWIMARNNMVYGNNQAFLNQGPTGGNNYVDGNPGI